MDLDVPAAYAEAYAAIVKEQGISPAIRKELKALHTDYSSEMLGVDDALWEIEEEED